MAVTGPQDLGRATMRSQFYLTVAENINCTLRQNIPEELHNLIWKPPIRLQSLFLMSDFSSINGTIYSAP